MNHRLDNAVQLTLQQGDPVSCYQRWRATLSRSEALLLVNFELREYWREGAPGRPLTAIYCLCNGALEVAVTADTLVAESLPPQQQYRRWLGEHQLASYVAGEPVALAIQRVAKPWGEELWYTAVEHRGVCGFSAGGAVVPIPWLQAALPGDLAGTPGEPLVLLKILAPSAEPVLGDLYFELHETKREVYVVTHIDPRAWPDGIGYIRYGFHPQQRAAYASDDAFRAAFLASVLAYRAQRRKLDALAAQGREAAAQELELERSLRLQMEQFTQLLPLREGDVIAIPPRLPHALQHGVRSIEFQTPSYERKIISFAQKVWTQDDWDSREAVPMMLLEAPPTAPAVARPAAEHVEVEGIVDFPDFEVLRVRIRRGATWELEAATSYRLLMVVSGTLDIAGSRYQAEQALLLPRSWRGALAAPETASALVFLLAIPRC